MPAFERKLNDVINKDKNLINKFPRSWRHPINTKFGCYRNNIILKEYVYNNIVVKDISMFFFSLNDNNIYH